MESLCLSTMNPLTVLYRERKILPFSTAKRQLEPAHKSGKSRVHGTFIPESYPHLSVDLFNVGHIPRTDVRRRYLIVFVEHGSRQVLLTTSSRKNLSSWIKALEEALSRWGSPIESISSDGGIIFILIRFNSVEMSLFLLQKVL